MTSVNYQLEGKTAVVQMDDGKANAFSEGMIAELNGALDRAEKEATAVVLTGREGRFSAGFDLKVMMSSMEAAHKLLRLGTALYMRLYGFRLPVVAACSGHAMAGGALLLLTADLRIGATGPFKIGLNEVAIGMPLPLLGMELARDRIRKTALLDATMFARIYAPEEAAEVGFLDRVAPPEELLSVAKAEASRLGALPGYAFHGTKTRLRSETISLITSTLEADLASIKIG